MINKITNQSQEIYGSNFSGWIFCQMNVTFSSTLSINYTQFYYGIIKTKIFSDISFQIRVIIYLQNNSKLAICLSICQSIFCILGPTRLFLWAPEYKKIDRQIDRHIANLWKNETYIMTLLFKLIIGNVLVLTIPLKNME